jgi:enediyne polyketide synthase
VTAIAVVGMACRYPDARSPTELWENALAGRQAFRRLPAERLSLDDYFAADRDVADRTYSTEAAVLEGWEFDRRRFRVAGTTFRSVDLTHWLALEVAADALDDAGYAFGDELPRDTCGVLVGNTLAGEFSRAALMRLRWPYVARTVGAELDESRWPASERARFMASLEERYKAPFPPVGEETLAGGMSNTIAGRLCNHFDLKGGGYTVDGACASSLLAVTTACTALVTGDLDVAMAGGVDLSLDPFELVGFAKAGALATTEMRVYDARSAGFWPGEGCGFVVLMRHADALAERRRIHAVIRGWGVSSDGSGGITRPDATGQLLAVRRAYRRAGFGIDTVGYLEGHGTGTAVGDTTELAMLSRALAEAGSPHAVAIGSVKANIGHTKAAAGIAGFIKTTMALRAQVVPPTVGCETPRPSLATADAFLRAPREMEPWPTERSLRAGVSAMGFGGINTHVVLESASGERRGMLGGRERALAASAQDAELFLLSATTLEALRERAEELRRFAARLSRAELADVAAELARTLTDSRIRAAVVAGSPVELERSLEMLVGWIRDGVDSRLDLQAGIGLGRSGVAPRVGFLFPGQASPANLDGGAWRRRFGVVRELYTKARLPSDADGVDTAVAQPAILTASVAGLRVLSDLGLTAVAACGHSLGELAALHWAGAIDEAALLRVAAARGQAMGEHGRPTGAMASIEASVDEVIALMDGMDVSLAAMNGPRRTVVSGEAAAVMAVAARATERGLRSVRLAVSHAFHSPLVAASVPPLRDRLKDETLQPPAPTVFSTVTGVALTAADDLVDLLCRQVTAPVRFAEAATLLAKDVDLLIEVGPGQVLSGLAADITDRPVVALDAGGPSLRGLLTAAAACFALGAALDHHALFASRLTRRIDLDWRPRFLANPCEQAPVSTPSRDAVAAPAPRMVPSAASAPTAGVDPLAIVRQLVAERADLPLEAVADMHRLLADLHLNSIIVAQLVVEAARRLGRRPPAGLTDWSHATVGEVAQGLVDLTHSQADTEMSTVPAGVDTWVRPFVVELVERPRPSPRIARGDSARGWQTFAPPGEPVAAALAPALSEVTSGGVVLCLPHDADERHLSLMLEAARAALALERPTRFVLVQRGGGGAALARTLVLETPGVATTVVDVPVDHPRAVEWIVREIEATSQYLEAHYDAVGRRREPSLRLLRVDSRSSGTLPGASDVLLVTGGGKGIAAESALSLARRTGVRLVLMGRSRPMADTGLTSNLGRMRAAGVTFRYVVADVTDADEVHASLRLAESELGPVTAILHGAGVNVPRSLSTLDVAAAARTIAPKVQGLRNVLAAVDSERLRWLVTFGSVIARIGLPGEADYALANDWLALLVDRWRLAHPECHCLNLEWSIWSGTGMGERLGRVDALMRAGVTPISPDQGVDAFTSLLGHPLPVSSIVVAGRLGAPPTLALAECELPPLRFLERPRVHYPGVELITDAELTLASDPYLDDHVFAGQRLVPAVMGLEAMAQSAMALVGAASVPIFEDVRFLRPIAVDGDEPLIVRIVSLARSAERVDVAVRTAATAFQADHFRATCRFVATNEASTSAGDATHADEPGVSQIDPLRDLYEGGLLFQRGRFRRLSRFHRLRSTACVADVAVREETWFGRHLPDTLTLGDAGARDAAVHAIQACFPHGALLPIGVARIVLHAPGATGPWRVSAVERAREGEVLTYDVEVTSADGGVVERWEGLEFKIVAAPTRQAAWPPELLAPYVERRLSELTHARGTLVTLHRDGRSNGAASDAAIHAIAGRDIVISRRPDGKPEVLSRPATAVSVAHSGDLVLAAAGGGPVACDIEPVVERAKAAWQDLLGTGFGLVGLIAEECREPEQVAATRVWAAGECLKKSGVPPDGPLTLVSASADGWVVIGSGAVVTATVLVRVQEYNDPFVIAALVGNGEGG